MTLAPATAAGAWIRGFSTAFWRSSLCCAGLGIASQWPALGAYFHADDWRFFLTIAQDGPAHFVLAPFQNHVAPTTKALIWLLFEAFGPRAEPYFAFSLALHAGIAVLVLRLLRLVALEPLHALVATCWWVALPVHQHTLRSVSALGVQTSTAVALVAFTSVVRASRSGGVNGSLLLRLSLLSVLEASTSAMGLAIAATLPLIVLLTVPRDRRSPATVPVLMVLSLVLLGAYAAHQVHANTRAHPRLGLSVAMFAGLFAYAWATVASGALSFVHVGKFIVWPLSNLPQPVALITVGGLGLAAAVLVLSSVRSLPANDRRAAMGATALAAVVYGAIAVGRSDLYSYFSFEIFMANLLVGHYQYLGTVCFVLAGMLAVTNRAASRAPFAVLAHRGTVAAAIVLLGLDFLASRRADFATVEVHRVGFAAARGRIEATIRSYPPGPVYVANQPFEPMDLGYRMLGAADEGRREFPGVAAVFAFLHERDQVDGRTLRFVDTDDVVRYWRARGGRLGGLLVTQAEASSALAAGRERTGSAPDRL